MQPHLASIDGVFWGSRVPRTAGSQAQKSEQETTRDRQLGHPNDRRAGSPQPPARIRAHVGALARCPAGFGGRPTADSQQVVSCAPQHRSAGAGAGPGSMPRHPERYAIQCSKINRSSGRDWRVLSGVFGSHMHRARAGYCHASSRDFAATCSAGSQRRDRHVAAWIAA